MGCLPFVSKLPTRVCIFHGYDFLDSDEFEMQRRFLMVTIFVRVATFDGDKSTKLIHGNDFLTVAT